MEMPGARNYFQENYATPFAAAGSRNKIADGWPRSAEAGQASVTGPSSAARTAAFLCSPLTNTSARGTQQEERDGQRERTRGHVFQPCEGAVVDLLHAADLVQFHRAHIARIVEVADRRVDEGEVSVLADPHDHQAGTRRVEQGGVARALGIGVGGFAIELVEGGDGDVTEQAVAEEAAEGGGMAGGHAGVLVHVESGDAGPVDFLRADAGEEGVLRHG